MSRRARKAKNSTSAPASSGDEASTKQKKGGKAPKKGRKWDADGFADEDDDVQLDYSRPSLTSDSEAEQLGRSSAVDHVDSSTWGSSKKGKFVLRDLGDEVQSILATAEAEKAAAASRSDSKSGLFGSGVNAISGLFRNVVGGKTLTKEDLDTAMKGMEEHLLKKNVAREAAIRLCEGVEKELIGVKTGNFESELLPLLVIQFHKCVCSNQDFLSFFLNRHQCKNSNSNGVFPNKNVDSHVLARSPSRDRLHHSTPRHLPPKTQALRHVHRWSQRRRQID